MIPLDSLVHVAPTTSAQLIRHYNLFVVILSVPLAVLGALGLEVARGFPNDVFCQIGLVMLVGLSSKNAILIVEFAEHLRTSGHTAVDGVVEAATTRLRPILMTSIALLLGVVPLMIGSGAGAAARNSLGTSVFGGMFVLVQGLRTRKKSPPPPAEHVEPSNRRPNLSPSRAEVLSHDIVLPCLRHRRLAHR